MGNITCLINRCKLQALLIDHLILLSFSPELFFKVSVVSTKVSESNHNSPTGLHYRIGWWFLYCYLSYSLGSHAQLSSCNEFSDYRRSNCANYDENCDTNGPFCCDRMKCSEAKQCIPDGCLGRNGNCENDWKACCRGLKCEDISYSYLIEIRECLWLRLQFSCTSRPTVLLSSIWLFRIKSKFV